MTAIERAIIFATNAHKGQMRKDGVTPYIVHPLGVTESVRRAGGSEAQYIAALLHDTIEDCGIADIEIELEFGEEVLNLVVELTNVYEKEAYPHLNRAARHQLEDERIMNISDAAKLVKICDIAYNINDLSGIQGGFKFRMLDEKEDTLNAIKANASEEIKTFANKILAQLFLIRGSLKG